MAFTKTSFTKILMIAIFMLFAFSATAKERSILTTSIGENGHCIAFDQQERPFEELPLTVENCPDILFAYPQQRSVYRSDRLMRKQSSYYLIAPNGNIICNLSNRRDETCNRLKKEIKLNLPEELQ